MRASDKLRELEFQIRQLLEANGFTVDNTILFDTAHPLVHTHTKGKDKFEWIFQLSLNTAKPKYGKPQ
jgi:hypothetical protein